MRIGIIVSQSETYLHGVTVAQLLPGIAKDVRAIQYDTDAAEAEFEHVDSQQPNWKVPAHDLDFMDDLLVERKAARVKLGDDKALTDKAEDAFRDAHREACKVSIQREAERRRAAAEADADREVGGQM